MNKRGERRARQCVIVALDEPWAISKRWISRLKGKVWGFKIGSILYAERGPALVRELTKQKLNVFLDLKYHDIPNTVQFSVKRSFEWGAKLVTVHATGGRSMLSGVSEFQKKSRQILAVTVLTSFSDEDLKDVGVSFPVSEQVNRLAALAIGSGIQGLVCSAHEVKNLREKFPNAVLVVPGVRFEQRNDDQKRVATAGEALRNGASYLVVGRAITGERDWKKAWEKLTGSLAEIS